MYKRKTCKAKKKLHQDDLVLCDVNVLKYSILYFGKIVGGLSDGERTTHILLGA